MVPIIDFKTDWITFQTKAYEYIKIYLWNVVGNSIKTAEFEMAGTCLKFGNGAVIQGLLSGTTELTREKL